MPWPDVQRPLSDDYEAMITKIHHVGIVVRSLETALRFYRDHLGLPLTRLAPVPNQGVRVALLGAGESEVELLEPTVSGTGVARFLDRRGEGLHHLCFESDDIGRELARLGEQGVALIDETPRRGVAGMIAFLHPQATAGILVELATPLEHVATPMAACRVQYLVAGVEDPPAAARLYQDLLGVEIRNEDAGRLASVLPTRGSVFLEFRQPGDQSLAPIQPGLSVLALAMVNRSMSDDVRAAISLGPSASHGVRLTLVDKGV